jgi:hypothetical protein
VIAIESSDDYYNKYEEQQCMRYDELVTADCFAEGKSKRAVSAVGEKEVCGLGVGLQRLNSCSRLAVSEAAVLPFGDAIN